VKRISAHLFQTSCAQMSSLSSTTRCIPLRPAMSSVELDAAYPQSRRETAKRDTLVEPTIIWSDLSPALQNLINHIDNERTELTPPSTHFLPSRKSNQIEEAITYKYNSSSGFDPKVVLFLVSVQKSKEKNGGLAMKPLPGLGLAQPELHLRQHYIRGWRDSPEVERGNREWLAALS
jgi:hypothetical protein